VTRWTFPLVASVGHAALMAMAGSMLAVPTHAQQPTRQALSQPAPQVANASTDPLAAASQQVDGLSRQGLETAVLVGLALPSERQTVANTAMAALDKLQQAEMQLSARAIELQALDAKAAQQIRQRDLAVRLPLLRARASLLAGAAGNDLARLSTAIDLLEPLDPIAVAPAALRRYLLALALYHRAILQGVPPGAPDAGLGSAIETLRSMRDWPIGADVNTQVPPALAADVWFAQVHIATHASAQPTIAQRAGEIESRPPFVATDVNQMADPGLFARHAQVRASALAMLWASKPGVLSFDEVLKPIEQTMLSARLGLTTPQADEARKALIGRAAALAIARGGSQAEMPAAAVVAAGRVLSSDPLSRPQAVAILDRAIKRPDLGALLPEALVYSALALSERIDAPAKDQVESIKRLVRALESGLTEPIRSGLLSNLPGYAQRALQAAEKDTPRDSRLVSEAMELRLRSLRLAGRSSPGGATSGATGLALAEEELKPVDYKPDAAVLTRVLEALGTVPAGSPQSQRAKELAAFAINAATVRAQEMLRNSADPTLGAGELLRAAQAGITWFTTSAIGVDPLLASRCKARLAEALAATGQSQAIEMYRELLAIEPPPESPMILTIGLARAQRSAGDAVGAFATYRSMVELLENAQLASKPPEYFLAWAEMLAILASDNAQGQRDQQIRLRIDYLRSMDPNFGTPDARDLIEMVQLSIRRTAPPEAQPPADPSPR
jgi:hypothetical protein